MAHTHETPRYNRAFAIGIGLNVAFVAIEFVYGALAGSLALVADAGHNLSDVIGLLLAWGAWALGSRRPSPNFTYGLQKASILAALFSALLLLAAMGAIAWEAAQRFADPAPVQGTTVLTVAGIGVVINAVTAWLFHADREHDLNIRGAYLHMAADAAVSLGVVISGALILWTDLRWLDPLTSLAVVVVVLAGTWGLLRDSARLSLDAVPSDLDVTVIREWLTERPGIRDVHDLHVWAMSTTRSALTVHLVADADRASLRDLACGLRDRFGVEHCTIQIERPDERCDSDILACPHG